MNTADSTSLTSTVALKRRSFRLLADLPMRIKLLLAFLTITAACVGLIAGFSDRTASDSLTASAGAALKQATAQNGLAAGDYIERQISALRALSLNQLLIAQAAASNHERELHPPSAAELKALDRQWADADISHPLIATRLHNPAADELRRYIQSAPDTLNLLITDKYGGVVAASERPLSYSQAEQSWWQAAWNTGQGATTIAQPRPVQSTQPLTMDIALPLYDLDAKQVIGVVHASYRRDGLLKLIDGLRFGETGRAKLLLPGGLIASAGAQLAPVSAELGQPLQAAASAEYAELTLAGTPSLISLAPIATLDRQDAISGLGWQLVMQRARDESFAPVDAARQMLLIACLGVLFLAGLLALLAAQLISAPFARLTAVASEITAGDLSRRLGLRRRDEIGIMAANFDTIAQALEARMATEQEIREEARWRQQNDGEYRAKLELALSEYLAFVQQVAQGDLRQRLPSQPEGALGQLGEGLNQLVAGLQSSTVRLQRSASTIAASLAQISAAQETSLALATAAIEALRPATTQALDRAGRAAQSSQGALALARQSSESIGSAAAGLEQLQQQVEGLSNSIQALAEQTRDSNTIVASVSELSDQISRLMLSAAIESTRAAQQEDLATLVHLLRDLGQRAKQTTLEVRGLLGEIHTSARAALDLAVQAAQSTHSGRQLVAEPGALVAQLAAEAERSARAQAELAEAAQQQDRQIEQIALAVRTLQQALAPDQREPGAESMLSLSQALQQALAGYRI